LEDSWDINRVIRKVRKTQHENPEFDHKNPEFGHTQGEIQKKPTKEYIRIQGRMKLRKNSSWRSFLLSASTAAASIFTAPNCTTTIISLEPCALNAEFQHSILSWSISY
jgi:hypothetical protein